jgi:hypothetical protein
MECSSCGRDQEPLVFRGWSRVYSFLLWTSETRLGGYVCPNCALMNSAISLFITALLGWLSFTGVLFYAWRSSFWNLSSLAGPPTSPGNWGAISEAELKDVLNSSFSSSPDEEALGDVAGSPLEDLTRDERELVMGARNLYAVLEVSSSASEAEIKTAYRRKAKENHPDLQTGSETDAIETMIIINRAWEILREPRLRRAYDWCISREPVG